MGFFSGIGKVLKSAAGPVLGSVLGGVTEGAYAQNAADRQIDFQRDMSNTQYQRAVKDLRAAGLNPIIAAGGPSSSPAGAMAHTPSFSGTASSAYQNMLLREQVNAVKAQAKKDNTQAELNTVAAGLTVAQIEQTGASIKQIDANTLKLLAEAGLTQQQVDLFAGALRAGDSAASALQGLGVVGEKAAKIIKLFTSKKGKPGYVIGQ